MKIMRKKIKSSKKEEKEKIVERKKAKQSIKSTIDWIDIEEVKEDHIVLANKNKREIVVGVKLEPHSLFLDSLAEQKRRIHLLRSALNRLNFDIWHGYVFNPVNLDSHLGGLMRQSQIENDEVIKEMLDDDIEKALLFIQTYRELEFFVMLKGKPNKKFDDQFHQLKSALTNAKFHIKTLNRIDFDNYISFVFENELVNDYYFSKGIFAFEEVENDVE